MRLGWLAVAVLVVAAACSGSEPDVITLDTTTTLVPISRPSTTVAAPSSTSVVTSTTMLATITTTLPEGITLTFAEPGTPEAEVEIARIVATKVYFEAVSEPVNPNHLGLAEAYADPALAVIRQNVQTLFDEGWAGRPGLGELALHIVRSIEVDIASGTAILHECVLDDGVVYEVATGGVLNDAVATSLKRVELVLEDGTWKVTEVVSLEEVEGIGGCLEMDS